MSARWNRSLYILSAATVFVAFAMVLVLEIAAHLPATQPPCDHHNAPTVSRTGAKGAPAVSTTTTAISTRVSVPAPSGAGMPQLEQQKDGELQREPSLAPGNRGVTGSPSSRSLIASPKGLVGAVTGTRRNPETEPVTADTEGQPRQDEASLPLSAGTAAALPVCKSTEVLIHCRPVDCPNKSCELDICCPKPRVLTGESASASAGPRTYPPRCPGQMVRVVMTELGEWATCEEGDNTWNQTSNVSAVSAIASFTESPQASTITSAPSVIAAFTDQASDILNQVRRRPSLQPIPSEVTDITGRAVFPPDHPGVLAIIVPHATGCVRIDWEDEVDQSSDCAAFGPTSAEVSVPVPQTAGGSAFLRWNVLRWYVAVTYDTTGEEIGRRRQFFGHYVSARREGTPIVPPVEGPKYRLLRALPIPANEALRTMGYVAGDRLYEFPEIAEWYVIAKGDAFGAASGAVDRGAVK